MKIRSNPLPSMQYSLSVELHEYDAAPPVNQLLLDRRPRIRQNDRDAIAAYLAFGAWASAGFSLPAKISPATAEAIRADSRASGGLIAEPIEYYPKALPIGSSSVALTRAIGPTFSERPELALLQADTWNGAVATTRSLALGSNAFVLDGDASVRAHLAVAVLFAADLDADSFVLDGWRVPEREEERLRSLLSAVRLGVAFA
jgi:hypothetical protein